MSQHIAIYVRVSSDKQEFKSQLPDLQKWADSQESPIKFYKDKMSGKSMERPGWQKLEREINFGKVSKVVVWRLDRLGRTAAGLTALFESLQSKGVGLYSLKDSLDLSTPAGRLMANVLASVAAYETEVRSERQRAGIEAAKAAGKTWGGSKKGVRKQVKPDQIKAVKNLHKSGESISAISRAVKLTRPTIYSIINE